jgi:heterodisulfide reductase subunit B
VTARYLYYPGCSLHSTAEEYDQSTRALLEALGLVLEELEDWNCCGATPAHATSEFLTGALPLRNLILAERQAAAGPDAGPSGAAAGEPVELLVPCAACYNAFRLAEHEVREGGERGEELNRQMAEVMGAPFGGTVAVRHPLEVLSRPETRARLRDLVKLPLGGLKVACYYGCLLVRPSRIVAFEDHEHPTSMDGLMTALGAAPVRWSYKTDCCGQSMAVAETGLVGELTGRIVQAAREAGAAALVTACPLCMMNLDSRQKPGPGESPLPVFFFTELAAFALGVGRPEVWWKRHLVDVAPALAAVEAKKSA